MKTMIEVEKGLLEKIKKEIERYEETIDGEWGLCRSAKELIHAGEMPEIWNEIVEVLQKKGRVF